MKPPRHYVLPAGAGALTIAGANATLRADRRLRTGKRDYVLLAGAGALAITDRRLITAGPPLPAAERATAGDKKSRRGGNTEIDDHAEVEEARAWVQSKRAKSRHAAAQEVAWGRFPEAKDEYWRKRLARRVYDKMRGPSDSR